MDDPLWHCSKGGLTLGPFSHDQLLQMIGVGLILPTDRVRPEGREDWQDASTLIDSSDGRAPADHQGVGAVNPPVPGTALRQDAEEKRLGRIAWFYCWMNRLAVPYFFLWVFAEFLGPTRDTTVRFHWPWVVFWPPPCSCTPAPWAGGRPSSAPWRACSRTSTSRCCWG